MADKNIYNDPNSLFFGLDEDDEILINTATIISDMSSQISKEYENVELRRLRPDGNDRTRVGSDRLEYNQELSSTTDLQRDKIRSIQSSDNGRTQWRAGDSNELQTGNIDEMVQDTTDSRLRERYQVNDINGTSKRDNVARRAGTQQGFLDFNSEEDERNGQHGFGNSQSDEDRLIRNVLQSQERMAHTSTGQTDDITFQHRRTQSESFNQLILSSNKQENFTANSDFLFAGKKDKFKHNLEAIKLVKHLKSIQTEENKQKFTTTKEEKEILSKFGGWGNLSEVFDIEKDNWEEERKQLQEVLTKTEWNDAMSTTTSAFYTPKLIIDTIYKSLDKMGINNDDNLKEILEPSAGNGAFLSYANNHLKNYKFTTVEKNHLSNSFLEFLYPNEHILPATEFQNINYNKKFDAVIGNPPYGNERLADLNDSELSGLTLHNYFLAKSQKLLKDDGICAFVVSSAFMDAKNNELRSAISSQSTFLGAVRLPNTAFKNAGTDVMTDIVFFKKGFNKELNKDWIDTKDYINDFNINEYFKSNPENILGKLEIKSGQFGNRLVCVEDSNISLEERLNQFVNSLPENIYKYHKPQVDADILRVESSNLEYLNKKEYYDNLKNNNFLIFNNEIYQKQNSLESDILVLEKANISKADNERVRKYIPLRDTHIKLTNLEKENIPDDDLRLINLRQELNFYYDEYHKNGDFFYNARKSSVIKDDTDFGKIKALEINYEPAISKKTALTKGIEPKKEKADKANILRERVIRPYTEPIFDNELDGLYASMNLFGNFNASYIADKLGKTREDVTNELLSQGKIFLNPKSLNENGYKEYVLRETYLSGDVKAKYREAMEVSQTYPKEMQQNLYSLKEVFPKDIKGSDISIQMGASWIPLEYYQQFFEQHFGVERKHWSLNKSNLSDNWTFKGDKYPISLYNLRKYSTDSKDIYEVAEKALNGGVFYITKESDEPKIDNQGNIMLNNNGNVVYKRILDTEETQKVNDKVESLKLDFDNWITKDKERRDALVTIYNENFNCYVNKTYDGSHLNFKGLNPVFNLRKHQKDAVYKAINEKNVLFDHEVGAGKTITAICSVMKQKELGIINKPLFAVPNHLVSQWENEFRIAYPNANILVAEEKSLSKEHKDEFFGKMINGNYDAIIITHTQLARVPAPKESMQKVINHQIAELEEVMALKELDENSSRLSIKQITARLNNEKEQLKNLMNENNKTQLLDFSDFGIDCLVVDESHMFKNLKFATVKNIKGLGNTTGSQKAMDLYQKTTWLNDNNKKIIFLTGTPISNSISELYSIGKYLMPKDMESKGINSFDSWVNNFGKIENITELDVSAKRWKIVTRLTGLNNAPEACGMYSNISDIVTNDDIKQYYKNYVPNKEIINEISPISPEVEEYIGIEIENDIYNAGSIIDRMQNMPEDRSKDNFLKATSDAKKAGIDFRLIDENAPDHDYNKINKCVNNIVEVYKDWDNEKGTQLVFLDIGTPKDRKHYSFNIDIDKDENLENKNIKEEEFININDKINDDSDIDTEAGDDLFKDDTFFLYGDMYKKLVKAGIPRNEIAFIHDTDGSNAKKLELFEKVNSGDVRVLIGSTSKMGAGTNAQKKIVALHHLDVPWKPSDLIQRDGRGIRQGNELFLKDPENFKLKIFRYATEKTYDAKSWEIVEQKSRTIVDFRKGLVNGRTLEGLEDEAASISDMKAISTGDPLFLEQANIERVLKREELLFKNFKADIEDSEDRVADNITKIQLTIKENIAYENAKEQVKSNSSENFKCSLYDNNENLQEFEILKDDKSEYAKATQDKMTKTFEANLNKIISYSDIDYEIGEYKGFKISGCYDSTNKRLDFELENKATGELFQPDNLVFKNRDNLFREQISTTGFFRRLNNFLSIEKLDEAHINNTKERERLQKENVDLQRFLDENKEYPKLQLLEELKKDKRVVESIINNRKKGEKHEFQSNALRKIEKMGRGGSRNRDIEDLPVSNNESKNKEEVLCR